MYTVIMNGTKIYIYGMMHVVSIPVVDAVV